MKKDLDSYSSENQKKGNEGSACTHFLSLINPLRQIFRRRIFHAVVLDECNTFRFLPALLRKLLKSYLIRAYTDTRSTYIFK